MMICTEMVSLRQTECGQARRLDVLINCNFLHTDYPSQYNRNPTPKYTQTTYRPASTVTGQTPSITSQKNAAAPQRETYSNAKPTYGQPTQVYHPEYDETLVSQVCKAIAGNKQ